MVLSGCPAIASVPKILVKQGHRGCLWDMETSLCPRGEEPPSIILISFLKASEVQLWTGIEPEP
jgi:hypothetical protein